MTKQDIIRNTHLASTKINLDDLKGVKLVSSEDNSFETYWSNSASQSYCEDIESNNVRQA